MNKLRLITALFAIAAVTTFSACGGGSGSGSGKEQGETDPGTTNPGGTVTKSSNADLSAISISAGTLSPEFSADITEYTVTVSGLIEEIGIEVQTVDKNSVAVVTPQTPVTLAVGDNLFTIEVTAEDGTIKNYNVNVVRSKSSIKAITQFSFDDLSVNADIDEENHTITIAVPNGTDKNGLVPTIIHNGETISPSSGVAQDFNTDIDYIVKAADGSTQKYTVSVTYYVTVTFDKNAQDANGSMKVLKVLYGEKASLTDIGYTRTDYSFLGWSTIYNGSVEYYDKDEIPSMNKNITLYACWLSDDAVDPGNVITQPNYFGIGAIVTDLDSSISNINNLVIPEYINGSPVTTIGYNAFYAYTFETVVIPDTVTTFGNVVFSNCKNITSIAIPASVTSIGGSPFRGCDNLREIIVDDSNPDFSSQDGVLYNKDKSVLLRYPGGKIEKTFTVPESVKTIDDSAFSDCIYLETVIITDAVSEIGYSAFHSCSSLKSVTIGSSVKNIQGNTFYKCENLSVLTFGSAVEKIGYGAFAYCESLGPVLYLPDSLKTIEHTAFINCDKLEEVNIGNSIETIDYEAFAYNEKLSSIIIDAIAPPTIGSNCFNKTYNNFNDDKMPFIYVPTGSQDTYKNNASWSVYVAKILEQ